MFEAAWQYLPLYGGLGSATRWSSLRWTGHDGHVTVSAYPVRVQGCGSAPGGEGFRDVTKHR